MNTYKKNKIIAERLMQELNSDINDLYTMIHKPWGKEWQEEYFNQEIQEIPEYAQYALYQQMIADAEVHYKIKLELYRRLTSIKDED